MPSKHAPKRSSSSKRLNKRGTGGSRNSDEEEVKKKKKRSGPGFSSFIHRIFRDIAPHNVGLTKKSMEIFKSFAGDLLEKMAHESGRLSQYGVARKTLSVRDMHTAVKLLLNGELQTNSISEGKKALARFIDLTSSTGRP